MAARPLVDGYDDAKCKVDTAQYTVPIHADVLHATRVALEKEVRSGGVAVKTPAERLEAVLQKNAALIKTLQCKMERRSAGAAAPSAESGSAAPRTRRGDNNAGQQLEEPDVNRMAAVFANALRNVEWTNALIEAGLLVELVWPDRNNIGKLVFLHLVDPDTNTLADPNNCYSPTAAKQQYTIFLGEGDYDAGGRGAAVTAAVIGRISMP